MYVAGPSLGVRRGCIKAIAFWEKLRKQGLFNNDKQLNQWVVPPIIIHFPTFANEGPVCCMYGFPFAFVVAIWMNAASYQLDKLCGMYYYVYILVLLGSLDPHVVFRGFFPWAWLSAINLLDQQVVFPFSFPLLPRYRLKLYTNYISIYPLSLHCLHTSSVVIVFRLKFQFLA